MNGQVEPDAIVAAARQYLGVPWRHQGRSKTGIDCLGLWVRSLTDAGVEVEDSRDYGRHPDLVRLFAETDKQATRLKRQTPLRAGIMAIFHDADWVHVGIMTGPQSFIHAHRRASGYGKVIEHILDDQSWRPRLMAMWRHPAMRW